MYKATWRIAQSKSLHQFNKMLDRYTVDKEIGPNNASWP